MSADTSALSSTSETELDVRYYADVLWRGRALIATAAVLGMALGLLSGYLQTPEYRAAAMIQIEPPTPTFLTVTDALVGGGNYWQNTDFYNTQFQILRSKALGQIVVDRLKLGETPAFKGNPDPGTAFMARVRIAPIPDSRLVLIQVTHTDRNTAASWANALADVYIEQSLETRVQAAKKALDWINERLAATQQSMRDAQDRLFRSYQSQDLFVPEGSVSAVTASIAKLNQDYTAAQSRRIALDAALNQVAEMRRKGEGLDTVPQVAVDSMVLGFGNQLAALSLELSKLREKFKENHPEVQKLLSQTEQVRKAKEARIDQIVDGLRAEQSQIRKQEAQLKAAIDAQKSQAASQSRKATELETLKKEADSAKSLYEVLLQKLNETDIAASIRNNNVSLIEKATPPLAPDRPDKRRRAGTALAIGFAVGIGLVLLKDYLENTIKSPDEIERYLRADLLAAVPRYDEANTHLVTEAYQSLRTALIFGRKEDTGTVVLVTSTAPQEGKTTTLVNVGKLLAASGEKTIVLDGDLRRAQLHLRLGLKREPGLTDVFTRHEAVSGLIQSSSTPNLSMLGAGPLPPNPPALLARKTLSQLLVSLRGQFEWILLDSPPLASVTDGFLLARHADLVVLVIQHNKVDRRLIRRNVTALRKVPSNLMGVLLNAVDVKAKGYYYYYYSHDHRAISKGKASSPDEPTRS